MTASTCATCGAPMVRHALAFLCGRGAPGPVYGDPECSSAACPSHTAPDPHTDPDVALARALDQGVIVASPGRTKWAEFPYLAFDLEATGVNVYTDRIVTAALIELRAGKTPAPSSYVVDPGIDIPAEAAAIHGYTRDRAIAEQTHEHRAMLLEVTDRIAGWLDKGFPVVAMNAAYDFTLLEVSNHRHGLPTLNDLLGGPAKVCPVIDPFVIDKAIDKYRPGGRKLVDLAKTYKVALSAEDAHDAIADSMAGARIFYAQTVTHPRAFAGMSLPGLHQAQVGWRRKQMDSLRAYFDKNGTDHDGCDPGWPFDTRLATHLQGAPA